MPDVSGLDIIAKVNSETLSTRLAFFTTEERESTELAASGAYGVILKNQRSDILVQTLRQIAAGQKVSQLPASEELANRAKTAMTEKDLAVLTERERQIMHLV